MGRRNCFKYRCDECGWTGFFGKVEFARKFQPRCGGCGSTFLTPTRDAARERILAYDTEATESKERLRAKMNMERKEIEL